MIKNPMLRHCRAVHMIVPTQQRTFPRTHDTRREAIGSGKFSFGLPVIQFHRPGAPPVSTETRSSAWPIGARTHTLGGAQTHTLCVCVCSHDYAGKSSVGSVKERHRVYVMNSS